MKIFLLSGKSGSGKDSAGKIIEALYFKDKIKKKRFDDRIPVHMYFAKYIKQYAIDYFGWDGQDGTKPRELLQRLGTDVIRDRLNNPDFHVDRIIQDIEVLRSFFDVFYVTDCRFPNEVNKMIDKFGDEVITIRINRPNFTNGLTQQQLEHPSETSLDDFDGFSYYVDNVGTYSEFFDKIEEIYKRESVI